MRTLIDKLEAAQAGSMGLSREVARAAGWINRGNSRHGEWFAPEDVRDGKPVLDSLRGTTVYREPPDFTRSLDAARTLVPEGWHWKVTDSYAEVRKRERVFTGCAEPTAEALNLCIAALKARDA